MWEQPQKVSPAGRATKTMYRIVQNICRNTPEHPRIAMAHTERAPTPTTNMSRTPSI